VEVHCFYSERFLVTIHRDPCPTFAELRERYEKREDTPDPSLLLYHVVDGLVDSFFPVLSEFDVRIDALEDQIAAQPNDEQLREMFALKRRLVTLRKAITPQRDAFGNLVVDAARLPGMGPEAERYFRDVYDHLIRLSEMIDSYRDLMTGAMDVYLSTVSNRLNVVMERLTVIATIFLPLSFVTGFFGQNFGWMVGRIGGWRAFVGLGIGLQILTLAILLAFFKKRRWF
jgi:magnesium transporter